MALTNGDMVELTVDWQYGGANCSAVFHYQTAISGLSITDLLDSFVLRFIPIMRELMTNQATITGVRGRNLFDETEVDNVALSLPGVLLGAGDGMPPQLANSFRLIHDNPSIREGAKRFNGFSEASWTNEDTTNPGLEAANDDMEVQLVSVLGDLATGLVIWATPVILGRILDGLGGYRLPESFVELLINGFGVIVSAVWRGFTGQDSRRQIAPNL